MHVVQWTAAPAADRKPPANSFTNGEGRVVEKARGMGSGGIGRVLDRKAMEQI